MNKILTNYDKCYDKNSDELENNWVGPLQDGDQGRDFYKGNI